MTIGDGTPTGAGAGGRVTVVGTGMLGSAVAHAFLSRAHEATVWNRSAEKVDPLVARGAVRAATLAEAIAASPLVVLAVSTFDDVDELLGSVSDTLAGRVLVNLTSGTPQQARALAAWTQERGATYLDAAAMSGTRLVGQPRALFLFAGASGAFAAHRETLGALGNAKGLGDDPGLASLYDGALFGLAWSTLAGYYHAVALVGTEQVDAATFADVATSHLPFLAGLMTEHAAQIDTGDFPADDGSVAVHAAAMEHLIESSRDSGISVDVPALARTLLARGVAAGWGEAGIASVAGTFEQPTVPA